MTTVHDMVVIGDCPPCGTQVDTVAEGRRRTADAVCPQAGCGALVLCRWKGERRVRTLAKQHPPTSGSTLGDIRAILRGRSGSASNAAGWRWGEPDDLR
jgi:hypothetical protein